MCLSQHVRAFCGAALQHLLRDPTPRTEDQPKWQVQWEWARDRLTADEYTVQKMRHLRYP
jgi:hypothetical protein